MSEATPTLQVRVAARTVEAQDICSFELVAADGGTLPAFTAGAHVEVEIAPGLVRPYSLCNDPAERHRYLIAVRREPASRGGSQALHERVQVGDRLTVSAPRNRFPLAADGGPSLLLAGGIGITPLLAMAEQLARDGQPFELHYCARSPAHAAFAARIAASRFAGQVRFHYSSGPGAQRLDLGALLARVPTDTHLYVCGPLRLIDEALALARARGWDASRLHHEYFSAEVAPSAGDGAFEVELARTGRVIAVPGDQTVTQALSAAGIFVPTSCEQGVCGTCLTRVLDGIPDHRDLYLTPEEQAANDQFTPCCSRAKTPRLVLDL
ncbi:oxidoreductase [Caldimonas thermodepolymerans]|jgi:Flavodoxin reductases (ferredoxin-NADPH reductases) family 1|uniref:Oxidoreductase n=1 Tax=Caldimonas thermodepolymerans TaxID=215580 RepID=A0A2S5T706_9BURK|nr:PDR/VanB family oxidoreductase [Caldimonas thermodepolymerans]PPE70783.1 oxidoreductase [Caldimonas thermodepolymerans]QPC33001.1 oxidoreductase [Caldimonas thermodepolymerans]RDI03785.1 vanillate O-demethylase ferredoxin subunit [Caldimonas thermodepolymerans]TCP09752.1 vanillate O-demethylase ferredoxin subunit [Caldimonas thermodepolymerans]UZG49763.1 PDR/VanB family oxidoreductase [Caldimonas thermodepolymerans]